MIINPKSVRKVWHVVCGGYMWNTGIKTTREEPFRKCT
jgi:hypothetical protein